MVPWSTAVLAVTLVSAVLAVSPAALTHVFRAHVVFLCSSLLPTLLELSIYTLVTKSCDVPLGGNVFDRPGDSASFLLAMCLVGLGEVVLSEVEPSHFARCSGVGCEARRLPSVYSHTLPRSRHSSTACGGLGVPDIRDLLGSRGIWCGWVVRVV